MGALVVAETEICEECTGTGSTVPDCWLCNGHRCISARKAYRHRYKKTDLRELDTDGYCDCPACDDKASSCMFCYGDGVVEPLINGQQRMRILILARHGFITNVFRHRQDAGLIFDAEMNLLSKNAAAQCRQEGLISWICSVFGDEIYLTAKGEDAADVAWCEYRNLCRRWIAAERQRRVCRASYIQTAESRGEED